ncbi:tRNA pseudouridine synthase B [Ignavibacterium album JCM 16511]|uniref:tRNA pseudouridine synthase B n=1 Tax=Ignavibacterium album (strain DSM 19864 / JCM 16511 / NBRC 101810 / Mat9-16) TaxID=945713 RepID=I0AH96_IGNAJ|nr:tRNA pseudouridine(55) synthase TruB [Ignavibacterium album]AFH48353.1 tRNA pseudouridine synthase B [Ignavibacterium album JCM 16511]
MITNKTTNRAHPDFQSGEVILIDKPAFWSSFKVVHKVRKAIGVKKVGHAGTLDPFATGLIILCTGNKTKEITRYQDLKKTYTGVITLGKSSDSMDTETEIKNYPIPEDLTEEKILNTSKIFVGEIEQIPPMYSAVKKAGKSLYAYARKGKTVEREPRKVTVYKFDIEKISLPEIHFTIECSKGTYIRVIADDFGKVLGTRAMLTSLRRTAIGEHKVEDAFQVNEFIEKFDLKNNINREVLN